MHSKLCRYRHLWCCWFWRCFGEFRCFPKGQAKMIPISESPKTLDLGSACNFVEKKSVVVDDSQYIDVYQQVCAGMDVVGAKVYVRYASSKEESTSAAEEGATSKDGSGSSVAGSPIEKKKASVLEMYGDILTDINSDIPNFNSDIQPADILREKNCKSFDYNSEIAYFYGKAYNTFQSSCSKENERETVYYYTINAENGEVLLQYKDGLERQDGSDSASQDAQPSQKGGESQPVAQSQEVEKRVGYASHDSSYAGYKWTPADWFHQSEKYQQWSAGDRESSCGTDEKVRGNLVIEADFKVYFALPGETTPLQLVYLGFANQHDGVENTCDTDFRHPDLVKAYGDCASTRGWVKVDTTTTPLACDKFIQTTKKANMGNTRFPKTNVDVQVKKFGNVCSYNTDTYKIINYHGAGTILWYSDGTVETFLKEEYSRIIYGGAWAFPCDKLPGNTDTINGATSPINDLAHNMESLIKVMDGTIQHMLPFWGKDKYGEILVTGSKNLKVNGIYTLWTDFNLYTDPTAFYAPAWAGLTGPGTSLIIRLLQDTLVSTYSVIGDPCPGNTWMWCLIWLDETSASQSYHENIHFFSCDAATVRAGVPANSVPPTTRWQKFSGSPLYAQFSDVSSPVPTFYDDHSNHYGADGISRKLVVGAHSGFPFENAAFVGGNFRGRWHMIYGDGNKERDGSFPWSNFDIVVHEIAHGFTTSNSDLAHGDTIDGGLNEAFSDITAMVVRILQTNPDPANKRPAWDYKLAQGLYKTAGQYMRDMKIPSRVGVLPGLDDADRWRNANLAVDVYGREPHRAAGIWNRVFTTIYTDPRATAQWELVELYRIWKLANQAGWKPTNTFEQTADALIWHARAHANTFSPKQPEKCQDFCKAFKIVKITPTLCIAATNMCKPVSAGGWTPSSEIALAGMNSALSAIEALSVPSVCVLDEGTCQKCIGHPNSACRALDNTGAKMVRGVCIIDEETKNPICAKAKLQSTACKDDESTCAQCTTHQAKCFGIDKKNEPYAGSCEKQKEDNGICLWPCQMNFGFCLPCEGRNGEHCKAHPGGQTYYVTGECAVLKFDGKDVPTCVTEVCTLAAGSCAWCLDQPSGTPCSGKQIGQIRMLEGKCDDNNVCQPFCTLGIGICHLCNAKNVGADCKATPEKGGEAVVGKCSADSECITKTEEVKLSQSLSFTEEHVVNKYIFAGTIFVALFFAFSKFPKTKGDELSVHFLGESQHELL